MINNSICRSPQDFQIATRVCVCSLTALALIAAGPYAAAADEHRDRRIVQFEVRETAGVRRRSDVVAAKLTLTSPVPAATNFRVLRDGKPIVSQIRAISRRSKQIEAVRIDFIDNFAPLEKRKYQLEYGSKVPQSDEQKTGFELRETDAAFHISNRGRIEWTVRKDLNGLFRFRLNPDIEYVQADSAGLVFRTRDGELHRLADQKPSAVLVTRKGPIACALEFQFADWPKGATSKVELEFVRTKSWVRATWTISEGKDVAGLGAELRLELKGREKLIDFGADDFVYTTVRAGEMAVLDAGPLALGERKAPWVVLRGKPNALQPQVVAPPGNTTSGVGGWAHVMDDSRCTAIAVGDFARLTRDRIEVDGNGRLLMYRDFGTSAATTNRKILEFWVHFVGMPVHFGARTSPQAMRSPLQVFWLNR